MPNVKVSMLNKAQNSNGQKLQEEKPEFSSELLEDDLELENDVESLPV